MSLASYTLKQRIAILRWALPVTLTIITILYQLWSAHLAHNYYDDTIHFAVEFLFYATVGPLLIFLALTRLARWLEEKEQVEKQARASEQRLASITAASADAIVSLDTQGQITSWNRGAELIFGYTADEMQGRPLLELFGGSDAAAVEFRWLVERVQQEGFIRGHETTCWNAAGQPITVELTATQFTDEAGQDRVISVILRDVTERKVREKEVQRLNASLREQVAERTRELAEKVEKLAQANAELQKLDRMRTEFVSLVSHQLRAPLTNMVGAVEHIEANCPTMNATCGRMVPILNQQVERLDRLVRDVLNMARIESGALVLEPEPISLLPIVQQVVAQVCARSAERPFRLPTKPGLPLVFADRDQVVEILTNLLDNADKYSPLGKEVVIDVQADQTEVILSVHDFGSGLPLTDLDRVFEKFHRTDGSDSQAVYGYGLGLYICRRLVEAQGGRIWAENHANGGAVFSFALPVAV